MNFIDNFGIVEVRNRDRKVETIEFKLIYQTSEIDFTEEVIKNEI
jgi:hypothetical protein